MLAYRPQGVPTREGTAATSQPPLATSFERAVTPEGDMIAFQRALVGDSLDNEQ